LESRTKITFSSNRDGNYNIYTINPDGSDLKQLTYEGYNRFPAWSPDGKKITFARNYGKITSDWLGNNEIWIMNNDRSEEHKLTDGSAPSWSPDGTKIVYNQVSLIITHVDHPEGGSEIRIIDIDGSNDRILTKGIYPSWSSNGEEIIFSSHHYYEGKQGRLFSFNIKNNNMTELIYRPNISIYSSMSPNDKKIVFSDRNHVPYIINLDDNKLVKIPNIDDTKFNMDPAWSPYLK